MKIFFLRDTIKGIYEIEEDQEYESYLLAKIKELSEIMTDITK
jgi:hypothetical protein